MKTITMKQRKQAVINNLNTALNKTTENKGRIKYLIRDANTDGLKNRAERERFACHIARALGDIRQEDSQAWYYIEWALEALIA